MSKAMATRLARLEQAGGEDRNSPQWLGVRKWLGETLTAEQEAELAAWDAKQPPFDPRAPADMTGWSPELREWWSS